ncbi:hypothetical protein [Mycobacteroides chelonae]|uniref:hypothetical protein n=1 Tax=Mycobacteroides chelonae TaxID=1774 RepID=UPI0005C51FFE|nr:hypothetical protein [Mycobacteroides chelonae]OHT67761.1 hypothetical protein BKG66_24335 [Mycobacteroides chelonae]OHT69404.1 hypothetical protein BKG67_22870 [Mycobacteroides chelonae]
MSAAVEWTAALSGTAGTVLGLTINKIFNRKKDGADLEKAASEGTKLDAEAAQIIANTAVALVAPLHSEIQKLNERVDSLEQENASTRSVFHVSIAYIRDLFSWIKVHLPDRNPPKPPLALELELFPGVVVDHT